jgi:polar amino acid transport system substrate-binding protein
MIIFFKTLVVVFCMGWASLATANTFAFKLINACGGDSQWPPMSYQLGRVGIVDGISVAVLKSVFTAPEIRHVELLPWLRCLDEVEANRGFNLVMSIFKTPEREKKFIFSRSYHRLTPSYLYSSPRYAKPPVEKLADLSKLKVCAVHGGATAYTQLPNEKIDSGAYNYPSMLKKIDQNRCDIVVDMYEVFLGFAKLGLFSVDRQMYKIMPLPETEKYLLYFAVSKKNPNGQQLINKLDQGINSLMATGEMEKIIRRYQ